MFLMPGSRAQKRVTVVGNPSYEWNILIDAPAIVWDLNRGTIATVTLNGNRTIALPLNRRTQKGGLTAILQVFQGASGGPFTLTFGAGFLWPGGVAPLLSTTAGARDLFSFVQVLGGNFLGNYMNALA